MEGFCLGLVALQCLLYLASFPRIEYHYGGCSGKSPPMATQGGECHFCSSTELSAPIERITSYSTTTQGG